MFFFTPTKSFVRSFCYGVTLNFISFTAFTIFLDDFGQQPPNSPLRTSTRTSEHFLLSELLHPVTTCNFEATGARILSKTLAQDTAGGCGVRGCHVKRLIMLPALQKVSVSNRSL